MEDWSGDKKIHYSNAPLLQEQNVKICSFKIKEAGV